MRNTVPSIHALLAIALLAGGCATDNAESENESVSVSFPLATASGIGAGYCITNGFTVYRTDVSPEVAYQIPADPSCTQTQINVGLPAGTYRLPANQAITCIPFSNSDTPYYQRCALPENVQFSVSPDGELLLFFQVRFNYTRGHTVTIYFGLAPATYTVNATARQDVCENVICEDNELCYALDDGDSGTPVSAPACYSICTSNEDCEPGQSCNYAVPQEQVNDPADPDAVFPRICASL